MSVRFWNAIANRYARQDIANPEAYETKLAATRALFTPESRVLEIGCGTGSTAILHAPLVGSIHGLDTSPRMIDIATEKAEGVRGASFQVGTVFDAPAGPYDVVLLLNLLHLVPDMPAVLRACHGLLKPGGVLIASTSCASGGWVAWLLPIPAAIGLLPQVSFFDTDTLLQAHQDAGFTVESCTFPGSEAGAFTVARRPTHS